MKQLTLILVTLSIMAFGCKENTDAVKKTDDIIEDNDQEVNLADSMINFVDDQKAMMMFYTSTGCPGCGSWGSPTFETIAKQYPDDVIPLAVHIKYGDPMITAISEAIASNRTGQFYTPQIWVNSTNIMVLNTGRINSAESIKKAQNTITNSSNSNAKAKIGNAYAISVDESKMQIKAGFIATAELDKGAEYYLGSYILENKILWKQASSTDDHEHNYVIRSCTEGNFGELVTLEDGKFESLKTMDLTDYWKKNELYVLTVLWKKVGNRYFYENAKMVNP
jgi:hypothetical protein